MRLLKIISFAVIVFFIQGLFAQPAFAATEFDLIAPSGQLTMGQEIVFTINIDTKGKSLTSTQIGMTYDTQYLEYINTVPGDTFTTVTANPTEAGKLLITGSHSTGYSGSGTFAYVTLKIIAAAPGATELCVLWAPTTPTTIAPTTAPAAPQPTELPRSGNNQYFYLTTILGIMFVLPTLGTVIINKAGLFANNTRSKK